MYQLCVWVSTINDEIHAEVISASIAYICIFYNFSIPMVAFILDNQCHGPLARYEKLWAAHAPGMPGTFPPATNFKDNR